MKIERLLTAVLVLISLLFLLVIIPEQIEEVDYGRIVPQTLPNALLLIILGAALLQFFTSRTALSVNPVLIIRISLFLALIFIALLLMTWFGFEFIAPLMALLLMALAGERRWHWLMLGGFVIPLGSWWIVENYLGRPLI